MELNEILKCYKELGDSVQQLCDDVATLTLDTHQECPEMMCMAEKLAIDMRKLSDELVVQNLQFHDLRSQLLKRKEEGEGWKA